LHDPVSTGTTARLPIPLGSLAATDLLLWASRPSSVVVARADLGVEKGAVHSGHRRTRQLGIELDGDSLIHPSCPRAIHIDRQDFAFHCSCDLKVETPFPSQWRRSSFGFAHHTNLMESVNAPFTPKPIVTCIEEGIRRDPPRCSQANGGCIIAIETLKCHGSTGIAQTCEQSSSTHQ
jgi:hypothetical protein